jgi:hypothetical protein
MNKKNWKERKMHEKSNRKECQKNLKDTVFYLFR